MNALGARRVVLALALALGSGAVAPLTGCMAELQRPEAPPSVATRIYLGTRIGHDRLVSPADWEDFLLRSVAPRFPDGFSVEEVDGFYRDKGGALIRERTHVITIVREGLAHDEGGVRAIEADYKKRFQQESVLRVDEPVRASFD